MRLGQPTAATGARSPLIYWCSATQKPSVQWYAKHWACKLYLDCCVEGGITHIRIASCAIQLIVLKVNCKLMACMHPSRQSYVTL